MAGNLRGCVETTQVLPSERISSLIFANKNVVDDDVDGDGLQADMVAQGSNDVLLDVPGYFMHGVSIGDRHGEVDDCGAAQYAHGGARMTMQEGGPVGERRLCCWCCGQGRRGRRGPCGRCRGPGQPRSGRRCG